MADEPGWLDLIVVPLLNICAGVLMLLATLLGLLVWFMVAPFIAAARLVRAVNERRG